MKQTVTAKIQLFVDDAGKKSFLDTMTSYTDACNYVSDYVYKTHDLKQSSLNKELYYTLRDKFGLKSQMSQSVLKTVIARYKAILETKHEWIKPEFKHKQYDLVWNRDYSLTQNLFSVNTLEGRFKLNYSSKGMEKYFDKSIYEFGTAKLVYKHKKFFLHIPVTYEIPETNDFEICNVVGIDRGVNFIITTYDSNHKTGFVSGKQVKTKRAKYKMLYESLQNCRTPSSRRRLKSIGQRENRWMNDVNHQVSKALVERYPENTLFVLEDLTGIRSATERVHHKNRRLLVSWSFYDLEKKIQYKAERNHQKVLKVDPRNTSRTCPRCGHTEKGNRNHKIHLFKCKCCNYSSNDDRIGAMNLYRKGIDYISNQVPDTVVQEHVSEL